MKAHPDDLNYFVGRSRSDGIRPAQDAGWLLALLRIARSLEPGLVFDTKEQRVKWTEALGWVEYASTNWCHAGLVFALEQRHVLTLHAIATQCWRGPASSPIRELPFIQDKSLRRIAERDFRTLSSARMADETKVAMILAGGVMEAVLLDYLLAHRPQATKAAKDLKAKAILEPRIKHSRPATWSLKAMILVAGPAGLGLLGSRAIQIADTLRDWRNFVHPAKEREEGEEDLVSPAEAQVAAALVEQVIEAASRAVGPGQPDGAQT